MKLEHFEHPLTRPKAMDAYIANMSTYIKLYHPELSDETIKQRVIKIVQRKLTPMWERYQEAKRNHEDIAQLARDGENIWPTIRVIKAVHPDNPKGKGISYGNLTEFKDYPMLSYADEFRDKIVSPYGGVYETTDKHVSFLTQKIKEDGARRDAAKGKMLQNRKIGNITAARSFNNVQQTIKINMNSTSGAYGADGNFLSSPANYNSCTSIARYFVMNAYAHAERFLESNFYFRTYEQLANFVTTCIRLGPSEEKILTTLGKIDIHIPTAQELGDFLVSCYKRYSIDTNYQRIYDLTSRISDGHRAYIYYMSNLKQLVFKNEHFFRPWCKKVLTDEGVDYNEEVSDLGELKTFDKELTILLSTVYNHLLPRNKKGNNISIKECLTPQPEQGVMEAHPEIVKKFIILGRHVKKQLAIFQDVFDLLMGCEVGIAYVAEHKNMYRHTVASSDTDSILFTTQSFVKWYTGSLAINDEAMVANALAVYMVSKATTNLQYWISAHFGACKDDLLTMTMKNEFMMPIEILTSLKKHYASILKFQEGVVYSTPRLDIKGVGLRGSGYSSRTLAYTQWFIENIMLTITKKGELNLEDILIDILRFERLVYDDITQGKLSFIPVESIKSKEEYKEPRKAIYFNYEVWEQCFSGKYGSLLVPTKAYVLPLRGFLSDEYQKFLDKKAPEVHQQYRQALEHLIKDKDVTRIPINTNLKEIPSELYPVLDIRSLIYSQCKPLYLITKSLGFNVGNKQERTVLFSDVYGFVSSDEALHALEHC